MYLFRKTAYWKDVLELGKKKNSEIRYLPTFIVGADTNLKSLERTDSESVSGSQDIIVCHEENSSAGKEGVRVFDFGSDVSYIHYILDTTRRIIRLGCT